MRWLIGIDLRKRSKGALQMGAWLCAQSTSEPIELVCAHVIAERVWGPQDVAEALRPWAVEALAQDVARWGPATGIVATRVVVAPSVEAGLAQVARETHCHGIVIGRVAPMSGRALVRLGTVARRMLRQLPLPVMVVPADMSQDDIGGGPLMLGTELGSSSSSAARFAHEIAGALDRGLVLVHVDPSHMIAPPYLGGGAAAIARVPGRDRSDMETWARHRGLVGVELRLADGPVLECLIDEARRGPAAIVVVGSRALGLAQRLFVSSVASDLARFADRPVLVVPAEQGRVP